MCREAAVGPGPFGDRGRVLFQNQMKDDPSFRGELPQKTLFSLLGVHAAQDGRANQPVSLHTLRPAYKISSSSVRLRISVTPLGQASRPNTLM